MLTAKEQRFIAEYLVDLIGSEAAKRAGYAPRSAKVTASRLLAKPAIKAAIADEQAAQFQRLQLDADEATRLNAEICRFDPIALTDEAGNFRPLKDIPADARRCIRRIRVHKTNLTTGDGQTDRVVDYEFYDKHPALDRDYRRMGFSKERVDMRVGTLAELVAASWKPENE